MTKAALLAFVLTATTVRLLANPRFVPDSKETHARLVGEDVRVKVGIDSAELDGLYEFELSGEATSRWGGNYYKMQLPVYCLTAERKFLDQFQARYVPRCWIEDKQYDFTYAGASTNSDGPLKYLASMIWFNAKIHRSVGKRFVVHITYRQPYLRVRGEKLFAYYPIITGESPYPKAIGTRYQLRLNRDQGTALDIKSGKGKREGDGIVFECRPFEEILVAVHKAPNPT